jgi:hypothetical protein
MRAMLKTELSENDPDAEPAPAVASDAEIELAQRLRRQLEARYLGTSAEPSPLPSHDGR